MGQASAYFKINGLYLYLYHSPLLGLEEPTIKVEKSQDHEYDTIVCSADSKPQIEFYVWEDVTKVKTGASGRVILDGMDKHSLLVKGPWVTQTEMTIRCTVRITVDGVQKKASKDINISPSLSGNCFCLSICLSVFFSLYLSPCECRSPSLYVCLSVSPLLSPSLILYPSL